MPNGRKAQLNANGRQVPRTKYFTVELTDYAINRLTRQITADKPSRLHLSDKAVHHDFSPAPRHESKFADVEVAPLPTEKRDAIL